MSQKIALVTGASRGLGAALSEELARRGWHVVALARTIGGLEELDERVAQSAAKGAVTLAPMDVTNQDAMRHLCRSIHDRWGRLDFWAHTAIHASPLGPADLLDFKDFERASATNLHAAAFLIAMVAPLLQASPAGAAMFFEDPIAGQKFSGSYGASKAGQIALARAWQAEGARIGPRVLIERPAPMPTALRARFFPGEERSQCARAQDEAARLLDLLSP